MNFELVADVSAAPLSAIVSLLYSFNAAGDTFVADDAAKSLSVQLNGATALSAAQLAAINAVPYALKFVVPAPPAPAALS